MRRLAALLGFFFATATASCSFLLDFEELEGPASAPADSGTPTDTGTDASVPIEDLAKEYAGAICQHYATCLGPALPLYFGDEDCVKMITRQLADTIFAGLPSLTPSTFEYHADRVPACLDALRAAPCKEFSPIPDACDEALEGKVAPEGDCTHPAQCMRGYYCKVSAGCPGTCTQKPIAGQPCANKVCAEGLYCDGTVCAEQVTTEGAECRGGVAPECALDMICLGAFGKPGHCAKIASLFTSKLVDATCNWDIGPLCADGLRCELLSPLEFNNKTFNGKCVQQKAPGAACRVAIPDVCPKDYYCPSVEGFCKPLPEADYPCAADSYIKDPCRAETRCIANTACKAVLPLDVGCSTSAVCASGNCSDGLCKPPNWCTLSG